MIILQILGIILAVAAVLFVLLFVVYFFNLDMKLAVCVIAPFLEKIYDKRDKSKDHYV